MLLRNTLLFLSRQEWLRRWLQRSKLTRRVVRRFVAGDRLADVIPVIRRLRGEGIQTTLDHLGENVRQLEEAEANRNSYLEALREIHGEELPSTISLKLTQLGLDHSESVCRAHLMAVAEAAASTGRRVEIDMESSAYVDRTLAIVRDAHGRFGNVRAVIQAYLYRSEEDVRALCREGIPVRLCKGAYLEPPAVAFPSKKQVDANYVKLARILLDGGPDPAFATHDKRMIGGVLDYAVQHNIAAGTFEFQMLYGVRRDLQRKLVKKGFRLRLYVPYGEAWYPYFMRRLAERPANMVFLLKNLARA
jgi:proline dehydrogenase